MTRGILNGSWTSVVWIGVRSVVPCIANGLSLIVSCRLERVSQITCQTVVLIIPLEVILSVRVVVGTVPVVPVATFVVPIVPHDLQMYLSDDWMLGRFRQQRIVLR